MLKYTNKQLVSRVMTNSNPLPVQEDLSKVFRIIWRWVKNTYAIKAERHPEKFQRWLKVRETCKEIMFGWCTRLRDIHAKPVAIIRLSLQLLFHQCPYSIWEVFSHTQIVLSINTTKELAAVAVAIPLPVWNNWQDHADIAVLGADNMSYITQKAMVRVEGDKLSKSTWLDTINIWQRWNQEDSFPAFSDTDKMYKHIPDVHVAAQCLLLQHSDMMHFLKISYSHCMEQVAQNVSLLARPVME